MTSIDAEHRMQPATGHFMLTLCRLAAPVSLRPPQSPRLKPFTFFTSRAPQPDGGERLYLHMGYFETLADAEKWVEAVRNRYPDAFASIAPAALSRTIDCGTPSLTEASSESTVRSSAFAPLAAESLTDTQVLKVLETRGVGRAADAVETTGDQIALLRPEDTGTRHALKAAVAQGAPVSFAVQLHWSAQPIDLSRLPPLAMFKAHALYATESRREGRCRYFLRLGFFADPISAKQVAAQLISHFASAAVVPVAEREVTRVREGAVGGTAIPYLAEERIESASDSAAVTETTRSSPVKDIPYRIPRRPETLKQTLERLARREMWTDPDTLSDTGVRHLKIEVDERTKRRS